MAGGTILALAAAELPRSVSPYFHVTKSPIGLNRLRTQMGHLLHYEHRKCTLQPTKRLIKADRSARQLQFRSVPTFCSDRSPQTAALHTASTATTGLCFPCHTVTVLQSCHAPTVSLPEFFVAHLHDHAADFLHRDGGGRQDQPPGLDPGDTAGSLPRLPFR